jgi:hypothetical protein
MLLLVGMSRQLLHGLHVFPMQFENRCPTSLNRHRFWRHSASHLTIDPLVNRGFTKTPKPSELHGPDQSWASPAVEALFRDSALHCQIVTVVKRLDIDATLDRRCRESHVCNAGLEFRLSRDPGRPYGETQNLATAIRRGRRLFKTTREQPVASQMLLP